MASKTLASLVVRIGADVTGVTAGLNTLDKRVRSTKKQFSTVRDSTLRWQSALQVLAGAAGLAYVSKRLFDLGSAVEETGSKFRTVFGPATADAQKFLDEFANTAGLTNVAAQELMATTGAIAQGMGFAGAASAAFAEDITRVAGDLSSFNNIPIAETARAVQSALTGERESLKRLGIVILETDVQQKALAMTGKTNAKALTQQEKATATLALIQERAGVAMGDLERTMDSSANRARKLAAEFGDLRDGLATGLMPVFEEVLAELDKMAGGFDNLSDKINENGPKLRAWTKFAIASFKAVALSIIETAHVAIKLGGVIGELAAITFHFATKNMVAATIAVGRLVTHVDDIAYSVENVASAYALMVVESENAWGTFETGTAASDTLATSLGTVASAAAGVSAALANINTIDFRASGMISEAEQAARDARLGVMGNRDNLLPFGNTLTPRFGGPGGPIPGSGSQPSGGISMDGLRGQAGKAAGYLGAVGNALPGKAGNVVNAIGGVASAFATGGPLLGGIAAAGLAFKGLKSLFGGGKDKMQLFLESVQKARKTLDLQFGLLDIDSAARQFELTLMQAQSVFKGNKFFEGFFDGLTMENIQERIDNLLSGGEGKAKFNLGTDSEFGKAFLDFISRLESLADATESVTKAFNEAVNIPIALPLAYLRQQAHKSGGDFGGKGDTGGVVDPNGFGRRSQATVYNIVVNGAVSPIETARAVMDGIRQMKGAGQSIELDRHYQLRPA